MTKNNITKFDLIRNLSVKTGFSNLYSKKLINDLLNLLILSIKKDTLKLKNIGTFKVVKKKERMGRNPKTKESFIINAQKSINFISSKKLSNKLNQIK